MTYKIEIRPKAAKFLNEVPKCDKQRILNRINELSENPRNDHVIKLHGESISTYRARQEDYRIFFNIQDDILLIEVIDVKTRQDSYKKS